MVVPKGAVFVFDLDGNDGAAVLEKQRGDFLGKARKPRIHGGNVFGIGGAKNERVVLEKPAWIAAEIPLRTNVRAGAEDDVETFLLGFADVLGDIVLPGEVVDSRSRLVEVPKDIGGDGVKSHRAGLAEAVAPVSAGHAGIVHLARKNLVGLAVKLKLAVGDREGMGGLRCGRLGEGENGCENQRERKKSSVHCSNEFSVAHLAAKKRLRLVAGHLRLASFYFAGDAIVFSARDDVPFGQIFGIAIRASFDDALCSVVVNSGKALEVVGRSVIDVDRPLLLDALNNALGDGFGVANCG